MLYWSNYRIIRNFVWKMFSLFAKSYMVISTKMAPKPYIETLISMISIHSYSKLSYHNSSYWNIDIWNIKLPNHIEPKMPHQTPYRTSTTIGHANIEVISVVIQIFQWCLYATQSHSIKIWLAVHHSVNRRGNWLVDIRKNNEKATLYISMPPSHVPGW